MTLTIVVGSGPAGVSVAWPLVEAGRPVLMLDASDGQARPASPTGSIGAFRRDPERWRSQFGAELGGLWGGGAQSPKLSTPLGRAVTGGYAAAIGLHARDFLAVGSLGAGGLSSIWGGVAAVFDDADLVGFPFSRAALLPSYEAVMRRMGVSGPEGGPALTAAAARVARAYAAGPPDGLNLVRPTNAVVMETGGDRLGCLQCGLCLWGCARRSIYESGIDLERLRRFPNFSYHPGVVVRAVEADPAGHAAIVEDGLRFAAPRLVLAAGTIASTALVLRRLGRQGEAVRLLTNPVGAMAFVVPRLIGAGLPEHSFALAQLSHTVGLPGGGTATGALYGADTLPLTEVAGRLPFSRPVALRLSRALAPALLLATIYLPGRFSRNTLRTEAAGEPPHVAIQGGLAEGAPAALAHAARELARGMRRLGAYALPGSFTRSEPGADAHYAGTLPMGSACSDLGELPGVPGLHVADGAVLSELPAKHCTLTIMANADRIGRRLARGAG